MKSLSLRVISLALIMVLLFSQMVMAVDTHKELVAPVIDSEVLFACKSEEEVTEIACANGMYMYFHDTPNFTVAINVYSTGYIELAKYDKVTQMLNQKTGNVTDIFDTTLVSSLAVSLKSQFEYFEHLINTNTVELEENLNDKLYITSSATSQAGCSVRGAAEDEAELAQKIDDALIEVFGQPYANVWRAQLTTQNLTATLYETMTFERYKNISWFVAAGSSIVAVAGLMGIPQTAILSIFSVTAVAGAGITIYSIAKDVTSNEYVANVHNDKRVQVGTIYPYRAGKTTYGYCYTGDLRATYKSANSIHQDFDFDSDYTLMMTGIENYISMGY